MRLAACGALILISASALAEDELSPPQVCDDEFASCKEGCTLHHGTSFRHREKLGKCLHKCGKTHDTCLERYLEVRHNELKDAPPSDTAHPHKPTYPTEPPAPDPKPSSEEAPLVPRNVTRGSELGPAVDKNPDAYPASPPPKSGPSTSKPAATVKASTPAPQPAAKPAPAPEPAQASPKKKDLSEWDPNDIK